MKYSEAELAEAAKQVDPDALYFEDLDWNNLQDKWGYTVTAWREHCPNCWDNLYQVVYSILKKGTERLPRLFYFMYLGGDFYLALAVLFVIVECVPR